jgi:hypothetical protein
MTRIMMATLPHVTSGSGLRKFQANGFLFDWVDMSQTLNNNGTDCQMFVKFGMNIIPLEIKQIDTQKIV